MRLALRPVSTAPRELACKQARCVGTCQTSGLVVITAGACPEETTREAKPSLRKLPSGAGSSILFELVLKPTREPPLTACVSRAVALRQSAVGMGAAAAADEGLQLVAVHDKPSTDALNVACQPFQSILMKMCLCFNVQSNIKVLP